MPAPIDFRKLFKDVTKYPDTLKFKIGDEEMELGVLRAWNTENEGALVKQLEADRLALTADQEKVQQARTEVARMYLEVNEAKEKLKGQPQNPNNPPPDPYADLGEDPIVGRLAQLVKSQQQTHSDEVKAIREENKKILDAIGKMGVTYMNDRARTDYSALSSDPDYDPKNTELGLDKLYERAVKSGYKDQAGIPDVRRAYRDVVADKREARLLAEARADERKQLLDEQKKTAHLPRPSTGRSLGSEKPNYKDLDGALAAAAEDATVWTQ